MKRLLTFLFIGFAFAYLVGAQQTKVTGTVTSKSDGEKLAGASVSVKGTTNGTITDIDGKFSITTNKGDILSITSVGFLSEEITVGDQVEINVQLVPDLTQLDEVVVTALGIVKKERGLTYSTQSVSGNELTAAKDVNMINSLAGKTAGITISKSSSGVGGSSKVILRGNKSISGANQPLYVIDGVPMNNANLGQPTEFYYAVDNGDAISNINPEDIESINVLKGAAASALYGSQAANGVVLITTKKGKSGVSKVEFSSSMAFESPMILPELQSKYGQAESGVSTSTWGNADNTASDSHLKDFFETGTNFINSLSVTSGNDKGEFYASFANTKATGIVPENGMNKNNFMLRGSTTVLKKIKIDASANIINQKIENRPYIGTYYNPILSSYVFPESAERFKYYKDNYQVYDEVNQLYVQNYPYSEVNEVYTLDNPYWITNKLYNVSTRNRAIFGVTASYEIMTGLTLQGRVNYDRVDDRFEHDIYASTSTIVNSPNGEYINRSQISGQMYSDVLLTYNGNFGNDISLSATVGANSTYSKGNTFEVNSLSTKTGLYLSNFFNVQNMKDGFFKDESLTEELNQATFGTAQIGYKNMLFADLTGRFEWASTQPNPQKPYFYPSAGLTFVFSELVGSSDIFNYGKFRLSHSQVGNALPFGVANKNQPYTLKPDGSLVAPTASPFGDLKNETAYSTEAGVDVRLFSNAINLEITYYTNKVTDQFFQIPADASFGYANAYINGGTIKNSGIEAVLGYKYATKDFVYSTSFNFATNKNKVVDIDERLPNNYFVVTSKDVGRIAEIRVQKGGSYGDFYGTDFARDAAGKIIVNSDTLPEKTPDSDLKFLGNPNPDWQLGWSNSFTYKNFSFKFLIDGKFGGEVISITESVLDSKGRTQTTADARDAGKVVIEGQSFKPEKYYPYIGGLSGVTSQYVYDATNVRLREVVIGYTLPLKVNFIKDITLSAYGKNLFFLINKAPFDPETTASTGNGLQGIEMFGIPSTRSFGLNLKVTF